jgi:dihydropteroate synthase/2-amino-4-hydroxy-6-hydroxymethyldihydropteridine diphosphokinase
MSHTVYLGLGTNQGDRLANIRGAISRFHPTLSLIGLSPLYETEPWGYEDQPDFLNIVGKVTTALAPADLIDFLKGIEADMGRQATFRYGPRIIDLDILFYDNLVLKSERVAIPHPRMEGRAFVLAPLADLAPDLIHPGTGLSVEAMLEGLDTSVVRPYRDGPPPVQPRTGEADVGRASMWAGDHEFRWGERTYVMGILNVTPDSFSGDGLMVQSHAALSAALAQAREFVQTGVDILDVGGESTRPGSEPVAAADEAARVLPVVCALASELDVAISIDTYKADIAEAALLAGAHIVNDVWALRADPEMARVVACYAAPIILMHNRSNPANAQVRRRLGGRYVGVDYDDLIEDVKAELLRSVGIAREAGIEENRIVVDPGIGFGKTVEQNLTLVDHLDRIRALGYPLLLGPSRKSFIGYTLDLPPEERVEGTAAAVVVGIDRGADIVRVHDVKPIVRVARMTDAIVRH